MIIYDNPDLLGSIIPELIIRALAGTAHRQRQWGLLKTCCGTLRGPGRIVKEGGGIHWLHLELKGSMLQIDK